MDGTYYVASARGKDSDWYKNICVNPKVRVHHQKLEFNAVADPVTDTARIADFLELRVQRHPFLMGLIMHLIDRLPLRFNRVDLETLGKEKTIIVLHQLK